jgi:hypothetical protein
VGGGDLLDAGVRVKLSHAVVEDDVDGGVRKDFLLKGAESGRFQRTRQWRSTRCASDGEGRAALEHEGAVALARAHQTVVVAGRGRGHQADFSKTPLRAGLKVAR